MLLAASLDKQQVYLDHAASTPLDSGVLSVMNEASSVDGNPLSLHSYGREAARELESSRTSIAQVLGASPEEIIFTGSGTESDNLAILGAAHAYEKEGKHIIISAIEHKAVIESAAQLAREGYEVTLAPVDASGVLDIDKCMSLVRGDTILVSVMMVNNELGTIQPIAELAERLRVQNPRTILHTDACQAAGYLPLNVDELGVDLLTINGSKAYGPKGVGVLYVRHGTKIEPVIHGGEQEFGLRAGTPSVMLAAGMSSALQKSEELRGEESARISALRTHFVSSLKEAIPGIIINGGENVAPHIVHVTVPFVEGESIVLMLDEKGVAAATGSACSSKDLKPSHVLMAIGQDSDLIHGSVRFSMGRNTTKEMLDYTVREFSAAASLLKKMSALTTKVYEENINLKT